MNVQNWVSNAGTQALQKLVGFNMDKLTAGLAAPSHLPQQPLVQKLEVSASQVNQQCAQCCRKLPAHHPRANTTNDRRAAVAGRLPARLHAVPDIMVLH
jgi:hypothetical protein